MRLADVENILNPALSRGQFSLAEATYKQSGLIAPIGVVLWARVSSEVDERITRDLERPLRLTPEEWSSGDIIWIVEAVGTPAEVNKLVKKLKGTTWKGKTVKTRTRDKEKRIAVREIV